MDPIAIVSLVATAGQLIERCVQAMDGLHVLHSKQSRAGKSLLAIQREYTTIRAAMESIRTWAGTPAANEISRAAQCSSLEEALRCLMPSVQVLADEVENILKKHSQNEGSSIIG